MKDRALIINHAFVLDINRKVYKDLARISDLEVFLLAPRKWVLKEMSRTERFQDIVLELPDYRVLKGWALFVFHPSLYFFVFRMFWTLLKYKFKVVVIQEDVYSFISFLVVLYKYLFKYKVIVDSWQNIYKEYSFPFSFFQGFILKRADLINAGGNEIIKVLRKKGLTKDIEITPLAYDPELFFQGDCPQELVEKLNLKGIVIAYFGRLIEEKGVQFLIEALSSVDFEFTLIIDDIGGDYTDEIKQLVIKHNLSDKVRYISPTHAEMPPYYKCLDILVLPTYTTGKIKEQFGRVLVEAMASGVCVIGSDCGEIPHIIGDTGLIFKEKDVNDLKEKLIKFVNDPELRKNKIAEGIKKAQELYSTTGVAGIYLKQILRLIKKKD